MKGKSVSQSRSKSRPPRPPSPSLLAYLHAQYPNTLPLAALTAAQKMYGRGRPGREGGLLRRLAEGKGVAPEGLLAYLGGGERQERGRGVGEEAVGRIYQDFANNEGKLSFEYLMKLAESTGAPLSAQLARAIVRKYGRRKDHLDLEDCVRLAARRGGSQSPSRGRK